MARKYKFKIEHVITEKKIDTPGMSFSSPNFPSTKKDEDFTEGSLTIGGKKDDAFIDEDFIKEGIETVFALNNRELFPVELKLIEDLNIIIEYHSEGHVTHTDKNPEMIPRLWEKYKRLSKTKNFPLWYSIRWYMRAIKAIYDPIDRYIYTWISFEMLMSRIVGEDKNFDDGIEKLINDKHISNDCIDYIVSRYHDVLAWLSGFSLTDKYGTNWSEELRMVLENKDPNPKEILKQAVRNCYVVRNTIFHGHLYEGDMKELAGRAFFPLLHLNAEIIKQKILSCDDDIPEDMAEDGPEENACA